MPVKTFQQVLDANLHKGRLFPWEHTVLSRFLFEQQSTKGLNDTTLRQKSQVFAICLDIFHEAVGRDVSLETCSTDDVLRAIASIRGSGYTQNSMRGLISVFKALLLWMTENELQKNLQDRVIRKIKIPPVDFRAKTEEDIISREDLAKILAACHSTRDRAMLAMMYDGSNRPKEIRMLNWGDLTFDEHGVWFRTRVKTDIERRIRLTVSVPYLAQWKSEYPGTITPEAPIFVQLYNYKSGTPRKRVTHSVFLHMLEKIGQEAGLEQHLCPSMFRGSRISHDIEDGYDQSYVMLKNWGHLGTTMLRTYARPREEAMDRYALEMAGMKEPEMRERRRILVPKECPVCFTMNPATLTACRHCGNDFKNDGPQGGIKEDVRRSAVYKAIAADIRSGIL